MAGTSHGNILVALVGVLIVALASVGYWAYAVRPCIRIEREQLVIVNPARTTTVRLSSIASVCPGCSGITVVYFDGAQSGR